MDEAGLWRLFFQTGLPEAWLALRGREAEQEQEQVQAVPAFVSRAPEAVSG